MTLRSRLFLLVGGSITATVAIVTWTVSRHARETFEALEEQRTAALTAQFRREFAREGEDVTRSVERAAATDAVQRMAADVLRPSPDYGPYVDAAGALARAQGLDLLDLVADDGTIVSSAAWPGRFGYQHPWAAKPAGPDGRAFLASEELASETILGLVAVQPVTVGTRALYVAGGRRLDQRFLAALVLPAGMRVLLYRNLDPGFSPSELVDASGTVADAERFEPLIARARMLGREVAETIAWPDGPESVRAIPLTGRSNAVLAVLVIGSSRRELAALVAGIRWTAALVLGGAIALGFLLSYVVAASVVRPIETLVEGARRVAGGDWETRVEAPASGEVGELARAFNTMTAELAEQRDRLVQAERVAAWRELARRLAHELKNPLFPLGITVENLQRAKAEAPHEFDEVFAESTRTLAAEIRSLGAIIARFGDFAKMPAPRFEQVSLNAVVEESLQLFAPQLREAGRPAIEVQNHLDPGMEPIRADPEQLGRALRNLFLNAIDAMPAGGTLTVRTRWSAGRARLEVSDSGEGLTAEERDRLFTPYYTTKQHGTGLGLAIVQSVVSDHHGRIHVESARGAGTTFHIELPA